MSVNKCLECSKTVASTTGIQCTGCNKTIHPRCTKLPHMVYKNLKKVAPQSFVCTYCENYKCGKCNNPVYKNDNSLFCESSTCGVWFHLKCTRISLAQYNEFNEINKSSKSPPWFCPGCLCQPFSSIDNLDLNKLFLTTTLKNILVN